MAWSRRPCDADSPSRSLHLPSSLTRGVVTAPIVRLRVDDLNAGATILHEAHTLHSGRRHDARRLQFVVVRSTAVGTRLVVRRVVERRVPRATTVGRDVEQAPGRAPQIDPTLGVLSLSAGAASSGAAVRRRRLSPRPTASSTGCPRRPRARDPASRWSRPFDSTRNESHPRSRACARSAAGRAAATTTRSASCAAWRATPLKPSTHIVHIGHGSFRCVPNIRR